MKYSNTLTILLVLTLSLFSISPFFVKGFFPMHDNTQVARIYEMSQALGDGHFPVRWVKDLGYGYGYPIFNFYAPFPYYMGGIITLLGLDSLIATKITMVIGILLAGMSMYLLGCKLWGRLGGVISALLFIYAPYHSVEVYVRGDLSEFFAYGIIPFIFYSFLVLSEKPSWKRIFFASISYCLTIIVHNLTAMMITPFLIIFILFLIKTKAKKVQLITFCSFLLGILLAGFYWFPVFFEMKYTNILSQLGGGANVRDHFVCIQQLWNSNWGFGGSVPGCIDGFSFKVGKIHLILSALAVIVYFLQKKKKFFVLYLIFLLVFSLFIMTEISIFLWNIIPLMDFFQYPWRFLILASFSSSLLGGYLVSNIPYVKWKSIELKYIVFLIIIGSLFYTNLKLFKPQTILPKTAQDYISPYMLKWVTSKISDEYMPLGFNKPKNNTEIVNGKITASDSLHITYVTTKTHIQTAVIDMKKKGPIHLNTAFFPGWKMYENGKSIPLIPVDNGMNASLEKGKHTIQLKYTETLVETVGDVLSLSGICLFVVGIMYRRKLYE